MEQLDYTCSSSVLELNTDNPAWDITTFTTRQEFGRLRPSGWKCFANYTNNNVINK
jgi:hypothetical protein